MTNYSSVVIIYNPISTGNSKSNALKLQTRLKKALPKTPVECIPTEYAGHAEELAYEFAKSRDKLLIVSSSGDGGYHEVINGAMRANDSKKSITCAVLPAGNANDHSRTMHDRPLWKAIKKGGITEIDLLEVNIHVPRKKTVTRYAHSYVGLGLTPLIAVELNRYKLNFFREISLVLKTFFKYRPINIRHAGKIITLDSLIFTNINKMGKILTFSKENRPDDGMFEVVSFPHGHKILFIKKILKAATVGLKTTRKEREYAFEVIKDIPVQLDGEVTHLPAGCRVRVVAATKALSTII